MLLRKGENDLMRMARKVIIHSRILAAEEGEEGWATKGFSAADLRKTLGQDAPDDTANARMRRPA